MGRILVLDNLRQTVWSGSKFSYKWICARQRCWETIDFETIRKSNVERVLICLIRNGIVANGYCQKGPGVAQH